MSAVAADKRLEETLEGNQRLISAGRRALLLMQDVEPEFPVDDETRQADQFNSTEEVEDMIAQWLAEEGYHTFVDPGGVKWAPVVSVGWRRA